MRSKLPYAVLLVLATVAASPAPEDPLPASISGELAFSEPIIFDYDRDGTPDRVQFWIELEGQAGADDGSVSYFIMDLERQRRVDDWLLGFNMSEGFPVAGQPYPITNLRITGRTARFELSGSTWTVTDNGDTWEKDSIEIETRGRVRAGRFYGGDLTVTPGPPGAAQPARAEAADVEATPTPQSVPRPADVATAGGTLQARIDGEEAKRAVVPRVVLPPADIKENRRCVACHGEAAGTIAAHGGPHGELTCESCHNKHPPAVEGAKPLCLNCHNSHSESITMRMCSNCHSSHDAGIIRYGIKVPDAHCTACHKRSAARLRESGTRHTGLACVICHRSDHGIVPTCVDCHGGPHAKRVMSKPDRCVKCHDGAHETKIDR